MRNHTLSLPSALAENRKYGGLDLEQGINIALAETLMLDGIPVAHVSKPPK
jgi:hypothetical protein